MPSDALNRAVILLLGLVATAFFLCTSRSYFAGGAGPAESSAWPESSYITAWSPRPLSTPSTATTI
jgi:hypothetical protein